MVGDEGQRAGGNGGVGEGEDRGFFSSLLLELFTKNVHGPTYYCGC